MSSQGKSELYEGLPKQFIASLRILFDILDEEHTGYIRLRDIASRWSDEGVRDLPLGVMEGLSKVTPSSGRLTFENFVAGLKLALLQGKDQGNKRHLVSSDATPIQKENRIPSSATPLFNRPAADRFIAPPSSSGHPLQSDTGNRQQNLVTNKHGTVNHVLKSSAPLYPQQTTKHQTDTSVRPATAAVKPQPNTSSNVSFYRRGIPQQPQDLILNSYQTTRPPPRPDRSFNSPVSPLRKSKSGSDLNPPQVPPRDRQQNQHILNELKSWQRDWTCNQGGALVGSRGSGNKHLVSGERSNNIRGSLGSEDPQAIYANIDELRKTAGEGNSQPLHGPGKATVRRHGSGRRHTLQHGVDQNMIKRMQQLEEENKMLKNGLEMVDVAKDWYLRQLAAVQEKQRMLGKFNYNDNSLEAHQERMNFQRARIAEVNLQLRTLVDSSEKGFPLHMNLAVNTTKDYSINDATMKMLKEQNRRLTQEVSDKSEKVSKLEHEKASLIRELFEARSKNKSSYDDTTFM